MRRDRRHQAVLGEERTNGLFGEVEPDDFMTRVTRNARSSALPHIGTNTRRQPASRAT